VISPAGTFHSAAAAATSMARAAAPALRNCIQELATAVDDMGQGNTTGLATILADELDADWATIRTAFAPADAGVAHDAGLDRDLAGRDLPLGGGGRDQHGAGGGAGMLVAAAAAEWKVPAGEITVETGVVRHASGKEARLRTSRE
jgi:CO/xanthine dehydrogenase Mo-binding subunit